jgi:hypothetical protein
MPPILNFASKELKDKVCRYVATIPAVHLIRAGRPCLTGEKVICLCITEPHAGSDVANIKTEAKKVVPWLTHELIDSDSRWQILHCKWREEMDYKR